MKYISPLLVVSDMERSKRFYEKTLGQRIRFDFGENVTFVGDFSIHLESHYANLIEHHAIVMGGHCFELYFEHDDVESMAATLDHMGVEWVHPLREQPWRQLVMRLYDPDRHIIEVAESLEHLCFRLAQEGLSLAEIGRISNMGIEFAEKSIRVFDPAWQG